MRDAPGEGLVENVSSPCGPSVVEVETVQRAESRLLPRELEREVELLVRSRSYMDTHAKLTEFPAGSLLQTHCLSVSLCLDTEELVPKGVHLPSATFVHRIFKLHSLGPQVETICSGDGDEEEVPAAQHWLLPAEEFQGVWDNLVYSNDIKPELLRYVDTALQLSARGVDPNIVGCNRVVLLHGPPGTGKTSLCKALAQKLSIRMKHIYESAQLIEINSHSLFSKWFSESGKLVQKMFTEIKRLMEDPKSLVLVLIDEVESLTAARKSSGSEPSDAMRVVNAMLTQLDSLKNQPNVLILTTSNITGSIDLAFVDRADIKQYIGPPSQAAIYAILHSCVLELVTKGLLRGEKQLLSPRELQLTKLEPGAANRLSLSLWAASAEAAQLQFSGRTLRKVPFLALASSRASYPISSEVFIDSLLTTIRKQAKDREQLGGL